MQTFLLLAKPLAVQLAQQNQRKAVCGALRGSPCGTRWRRKTVTVQFSGERQGWEGCVIGCSATVQYPTEPAYVYPATKTGLGTSSCLFQAHLTHL